MTTVDNFSDFYSFVFELLKPEGKKYVEKDMACVALLAIWKQVRLAGDLCAFPNAAPPIAAMRWDKSMPFLDHPITQHHLSAWMLIHNMCSNHFLQQVPGKQSPHIETFVEYLKSKDSILSVNQDQWKSFVQFSKQVDSDLTTYSEDDPWPSLFDEYVVWVRQRQGGESSAHV